MQGQDKNVYDRVWCLQRGPVVFFLCVCVCDYGRQKKNDEGECFALGKG